MCMLLSCQSLNNESLNIALYHESCFAFIGFMKTWFHLMHVRDKLSEYTFVVSEGLYYQHDMDFISLTKEA